MQGLKYLAFTFTAVVVILGAWMIYKGQYGAGVGMLLTSVLMVVPYLLFMHPYVRMDALMTRLNKEGIPAQASIVSIEETSMYVNEVPVMRVNVKYAIEGKERTGEIKQPIPYHSLSSVQPGTLVPILVDPKDDAQFLLQF